MAIVGTADCRATAFLFQAIAKRMFGWIAITTGFVFLLAIASMQLIEKACQHGDNELDCDV